MLDTFVPPYDATVVAKLRAQHYLLLGKTNLDEFAMGSSTENSAFGASRNPWNIQTVPGGSSGGSAVAVAADECVAALGSDTGGSIRQPAAFCGVVGLKPTYGRVSRYGLVAFASSLDQIGPITKDVTDAAILLGAIAGHDPRDSTSANVPVPDYLKALKRKDLKRLKVGVPAEYFADGLDPEVDQAVRTAIEGLRELGADIREIKLPTTDAAVATYYVIATARERLLAWAAHEGAELTYSDGEFQTSISRNVTAVSNPINNVIIIVVMSILVLTSVGGYFYFKRKKED